LIGQDNRKRLDWPLGSIIDVLPGKDGKVREMSSTDSIPLQEYVKKIRHRRIVKLPSKFKDVN
jgi:hypothetical protein